MVEQKKNPRKSLIWYCVIVLVVMAVLNTILMPQLDRMQTKEIDYGTFLTMLENGEIKEVQKDGDVIAFNTNDENDRTIYVTGAWDDPELVERCRKQASNFPTSFPKRNLPGSRCS